MFNKPAYIRLLHASPNAPSVDIYANGQLLFRDLKYGKSTRYLEVESGVVRIQVFVTGTRKNPVIVKNLWVFARTHSTVAIINKLENIALQKINEPEINHYLNRSLIRAIHLSPNAPAVDVLTEDGVKLFSNISYKQVSMYKPVAVGKHTLKVNVAGTDKTVLTIKDVELKKGKIYSVYIIGLVNSEPALSSLILEDKA